MELFHPFCCWTLIRLSRHWDWLRWGYIDTVEIWWIYWYIMVGIPRCADYTRIAWFSSRKRRHGDFLLFYFQDKHNIKTQKCDTFSRRQIAITSSGYGIYIHVVPNILVIKHSISGIAALSKWCASVCILDTFCKFWALGHSVCTSSRIESVKTCIFLSLKCHWLQTQ